MRYPTERLRHSTVRKSVSLGPSYAIATTACPNGKSLVSFGAALGSDAPANVSLQGIFPTGGYQGSQALAVETPPRM
jgi:hypothetical protein